MSMTDPQVLLGPTADIPAPAPTATDLPPPLPYRNTPPPPLPSLPPLPSSPTDPRPGPSDAGPSRPASTWPLPSSPAAGHLRVSRAPQPTAYGAPDDDPLSPFPAPLTFSPDPASSSFAPSSPPRAYALPASAPQVRSQSLPMSALPRPLPVSFAPSRSHSIPIHQLIDTPPAPARHMSMTTSTSSAPNLGKTGKSPPLRSPPLSTRSTKRSLASDTPYQVLPDEEVWCCCLGAPCPRKGQRGFWASLGELCVGAALCQCFPFGRYDPKY